MLTHIHTYPKTYLVVIGALCVVSVAFFAHDFFRLYTEGPLGPQRRPPFPSPLRDTTPAPFALKSSADIQPWMTFEYVNENFKIPPMYLSDTLNITDSKYPRVGIRDIARKKTVHPKAYTQRVIDAVDVYLHSNR